MYFEKIEIIPNIIEYKGLLNSTKRLEIMSQYDLLVIASNSEGLPIILIECLGIGLPFVTTNVGAISDLLRPNYPYVCESNSLSIAEKLERFTIDYFQNPKFLKELIYLNHQLFIKQFQYQNYFENIKNKIR